MQIFERSVLIKGLLSGCSLNASTIPREKERKWYIFQRYKALLLSYSTLFRWIIYSLTFVNDQNTEFERRDKEREREWSQFNLIRFNSISMPFNWFGKWQIRMVFVAIAINKWNRCGWMPKISCFPWMILSPTKILQNWNRTQTHTYSMLRS